MKSLLMPAAAACLALGAALAAEARVGPPDAPHARLPRLAAGREHFDPLCACLLPPSCGEGQSLPGNCNTFAVQQPIKRAGGARLKTSLNAYSFNKTLNDRLKGRGKGISLMELLDYCAELNFDAIDPTGYFFPGYPKPPSEQYLNDFKRRAFVLGLDISGTGVRNNFASPDREKRAADVRHVKEWVEVAARMGAPVLRVFAGAQPPGHTWVEVAAWMIEDLKECVAHGKKHGVLIGIQNHGDMLMTAEETLKIVKGVDSEWFGVIVDTGYFLKGDPYKEIAVVAPYAVNWQVKQHIGGKGAKIKTDLKRIVRIAREAGYRGYLPIETLPVAGEEYDPRARVREALKELRAALDQPD
jgi:sugar phosphate isomerase/epimerase